MSNDIQKNVNAVLNSKDKKAKSKKKKLAEDNEVVTTGNRGRLSVHAGPGYYLYDVRTKKVSDTALNSPGDAVKEALRQMAESGDFQYFYYNTIIYKDEADMYSLPTLTGQIVAGPTTLEKIHDSAGS